MKNNEFKSEKRSLSTLTPYANNSRTHSDEQIGQISASIKEWGFTSPVLIDEEGGIIAGHGRVLAATRLKMDEVPVIVASGWTNTQKRAYVIADNKLALNAGWDNELLALELGELQDLDFDIELTGFSLDELPGLSALDDMDEPDSSAKEIDPDDYKMDKKCPRCGFEFDEKT